MDAYASYKRALRAAIEGGELEEARQLVLSATGAGIVDGHEGAADLTPVLDAEYERLLGVPA